MSTGLQARGTSAESSDKTPPPRRRYGLLHFPILGMVAEAAGAMQLLGSAEGRQWCFRCQYTLHTVGSCGHQLHI